MIARWLLAVLIAVDAAYVKPVQAQDYPSKPIRIMVGFAAGGIADLGARLLADHIARETGQQAVVENRTGGAGTTGMAAVASAPPDGYTIGVALSGNLVINPFVQKTMPFDVRKDLIPVASIGEAPQLIAISVDVPATNLKEFVALAKAKPSGYHYGSAGIGSLPHLSAAEFARQAGIELVHVPYRGATPAITDLIAGRIHVISSSIGSFRAGLDAKRIRILLTGTKERLSYLPDVPTSAEAGIPNYLMTVWVGVVTPAGTPQAGRDRLHGLVQGMIENEELRKRMASAGLDPMVTSQAEFAKFVSSEYSRWEGIVKGAGIEPQ
jgi:tripartite-type tricarboxylate transporter receptor subunit TctC